MSGIMENDFIQLGVRQIWGGEQPFGISAADRRQHMQIIGASGVGKTTVLKQMIVSDLLAGNAAVIVDPHGDLAEEILELVPPWRASDLIYFDPAGADHPVGFNPLSAVAPERRHLTVANIITALKGIWGESWGRGCSTCWPTRLPP